MAKRSYKQNCALALTVDLVGERWSMLLIRDLLVGPKRYKELSQSLQGMGTNLLASRLKELESAGIIERQDSGGGTHAYALTDTGRALEPAILALVRWGLTYLPDRIEGFYHQAEMSSDMNRVQMAIPADSCGSNAAFSATRSQSSW